MLLKRKTNFFIFSFFIILIALIGVFCLKTAPKKASADIYYDLELLSAGYDLSSKDKVYIDLSGFEAIGEKIRINFERDSDEFIEIGLYNEDPYYGSSTPGLYFYEYTNQSSPMCHFICSYEDLDSYRENNNYYYFRPSEGYEFGRISTIESTPIFLLQHIFIGTSFDCVEGDICFDYTNLDTKYNLLITNGENFSYGDYLSVSSDYFKLYNEDLLIEFSKGTIQFSCINDGLLAVSSMCDGYGSSSYIKYIDGTNIVLYFKQDFGFIKNLNDRSKDAISRPILNIDESIFNIYNSDLDNVSCERLNLKDNIGKNTPLYLSKDFFNYNMVLNEEYLYLYFNQEKTNYIEVSSKIINNQEDFYCSYYVDDNLVSLEKIVLTDNKYIVIEPTADIGQIVLIETNVDDYQKYCFTKYSVSNITKTTQSNSSIGPIMTLFITIGSLSLFFYLGYILLKKINLF